MTPPAGPDIRMLTARFEHASTVEIPPFDWMRRRFAWNPLPAELALEVVEIGRRLRTDERVHRRGGEPLELPDDVGDVRRAADVGAGHLALHDGLRPALVSVVDEREQEPDDHRRDAAALEHRDGVEHLLLVERRLDPSVGGEDALGDGDAVAALDQRPVLPRHLEVEREVVGALVAADVQDVAEVARGEHPHLGAVVLDGDVGGDGGAVDDEVDVTGPHPGHLAQLAQSAQHSFRLVVRRARHLVDVHPALGLQHEIRIGASDVYSDSRHGSVVLRLFRGRRSAMSFHSSHVTSRALCRDHRDSIPCLRVWTPASREWRPDIASH